MRYRPSVSLDQAGYLPIPIEKGERGQKINREGKKEDPGVVEGTCSLTSSHPPPLFSLRSPLRSTRLEKATSCFVSSHKKHKKRSISNCLISYPDLTLSYLGRGRSGYEITSSLD